MNIDVYQDTVCPWCRIGQRHLHEAIARWDGEPVTVRHRPFELRPDMPVEGRDFLDHMAAIKGDRDVQPLFDRVCAAGETCDIGFRFDRIQRAPNTLLSHVLVAAAPADRQGELLDALHLAYFEQGQDIGDRATLLAVAAGIGLDRDAMAAKLDDPELRAEVAARATWARQQGITGVPFFVFADAVAVSGAQPVAVLLSAMQRATAVAATVKA